MAECGYVIPSGAPPLPDKLDFASWVLSDLDTGAVLAARAPHARQRPASIIKILLALVVTNHLDPDMVVVGTHADANVVGSKVGIGPSGHYTVRQLLYGLLMQSGNDAAHALARQLGGVDETVRKMDALARRLGAQDTRVARPSGLDGPGMSTSAYDESLFFRAAMRQPLLTEIFQTSSYDFPGYGDKPGYTIGNDNRLLENYPGDLGGKTGYTNDALHTYVNAAKRDGHRVALVMMRGMNHLRGMYRNADELMNYGFALEAANTRPVGHLVTAEPSASASDHPQSSRIQYVGENSPTSASAAQQDPRSRLPELVALLVLAAVAVGTVGALIARRGSRR